MNQCELSFLLRVTCLRGLETFPDIMGSFKLWPPGPPFKLCIGLCYLSLYSRIFTRIQCKFPFAGSWVCITWGRVPCFLPFFGVLKLNETRVHVMYFLLHCTPFFTRYSVTGNDMSDLRFPGVLGGYCLRRTKSVCWDFFIGYISSTWV